VVAAAVETEWLAAPGALLEGVDGLVVEDGELRSPPPR